MMAQRLQVKKDSEVDTLMARLDALRADRRGKSATVNAATDAEIAATEAALKAAQRAQYDAGHAAQAGDREAARKDWHETLQAIVETTQELAGLLGALKERTTQAQAVGVVDLPNPYTALLTDACARTVWYWDRSTNFTGKAAQQESKARRAVREGEVELAQRLEAVATWRGRLEAHTGPREQLLNMLHNFEGAATAAVQARERLLHALGELGSDTTMADRERVIALMEDTGRPTVTIRA